MVCILRSPVLGEHNGHRYPRVFCLPTNEAQLHFHIFEFLSVCLHMITLYQVAITYAINVITI